MPRLLVIVAAAVLGIGACDGDETTSLEASTPDGSTTSTLDAPGGRCPGDAVDLAEIPDGAVEADLDGNGAVDLVWVEDEPDGPGELVAVLDTGLAVSVELPEDPVVDPEIRSVVDIGASRDTLLVLVDAGAYTELVAPYGFANCELVGLTDPDAPDLGPYLFASGASVMNGAYFLCDEDEVVTVILEGAWSTDPGDESGGHEWSETPKFRDGTSIVDAGETIEGTATTEDGIGTGSGGECPAPAVAT